MIKKLLEMLIKQKVSCHLDAKTWIQKVLLKEKFRKINY
tara:strand:- start:80 stop:196 length:117 start_codon:yes stop_codon:yes gene_type:complete